MLPPNQALMINAVNSCVQVNDLIESEVSTLGKFQTSSDDGVLPAEFAI